MASTLRGVAAVAVFFAASFHARADEAPTTRPTVTFLAGDDARRAIIDDSADPYFDRLTPAEMKAKTGQALDGDTPAARAEACRKSYQAAVKEFTPDEQDALRYFSEQISAKLSAKYPGFAAQPWRFVKVADTLEGGMPHTRGDFIVLPARVAAGIAQAKASAAAAALPAIAGLLIHEQTHVIQRAKPELFVPYYTDVLKFKRAKSIAADPWFDAHQLINPDGTKLEWVMPLQENGVTRWVVPLIAFSEAGGDSIESMGTFAVELEPADAADTYRVKKGPDGQPVVKPLYAEPLYAKNVGTRRNDYHRNEIAAERFSALAVFDAIVGPEETKQRIGAERFAAVEASMAQTRPWATEAFKK